jgi:hypothetical protein
MSKRIWTALAGAFLAATGMARGAKDVTSIFEWRAALASGLSSGQLGRIAIPDDVFDKCRRFPGDLRISTTTATSGRFMCGCRRGKAN